MLPLRLFRNPVFSVASAISLAAGFALFGSISYLPLFLQVVHGVSPTSISLMSSYFFVLGVALGLIIQVLAIAVQNSADFADLGAATSGVTFFRSIGGSFGVSIFGAIFSNRLASELAAALRGVTLPAGFNAARASANPAALKKLPAPVRADVVHAYSLALHPVFLFAIPVALVAFVLAWFLREVPLRATSSVGIGEGLGATPPARSSMTRWNVR